MMCQLAKIDFGLANLGRWVRWVIVGCIALSVFPLAGCASIGSSKPNRVLLEWTTASEVNTAGFNLYRSENKEGPFAKVNNQIIPASIDPVLGGKYQYEDSGVTAGHTYYYQLEDVEYSGATTRHGPIVATASSELGGEWLVLAMVGIGMLGGLPLLFIARRRNKSS
jgi:hypothetical protein